MDFNIEFSKEAAIEFNIIDCYFGAMGINNRFHKDFHSQILHIRSNPFQFQTRYKEVRIVHLRHFNYSIHYNVVDKTILILRILNQHQSY